MGSVLCSACDIAHKNKKSKNKKGKITNRAAVKGSLKCIES